MPCNNSISIVISRFSTAPKVFINSFKAVGRVWRLWGVLVDAFRLRGHVFNSCSNRHVGTLGKSLTHNCLWCFGMKFRHSIRAVSGAPLRGSGLEEMLKKWFEWMDEYALSQNSRDRQVGSKFDWGHTLKRQAVRQSKEGSAYSGWSLELKCFLSQIQLKFEYR